jgi:hypothetical protein
MGLFDKIGQLFGGDGGGGGNDSEADSEADSDAVQGEETAVPVTVDGVRVDHPANLVWAQAYLRCAKSWTRGAIDALDGVEAQDQAVLSCWQAFARFCRCLHLSPCSIPMFRSAWTGLFGEPGAATGGTLLYGSLTTFSHRLVLECDASITLHGVPAGYTARTTSYTLQSGVAQPPWRSHHVSGATMVPSMEHYYNLLQSIVRGIPEDDLQGWLAGQLADVARRNARLLQVVGFRFDSGSVLAGLATAGIPLVPETARMVLSDERKGWVDELLKAPGAIDLGALVRGDESAIDAFWALFTPSPEILGTRSAPALGNDAWGAPRPAFARNLLAAGASQPNACTPRQNPLWEPSAAQRNHPREAWRMSPEALPPVVGAPVPATGAFVFVALPIDQQPQYEVEGEEAPPGGGDPCANATSTMRSFLGCPPRTPPGGTPPVVDRTSVLRRFAAITSPADRARLLREFVATRPDLFGTRGADNNCFFLPGSNQSADVAICSDWINRWGRPDVLIPAFSAALDEFRPTPPPGGIDRTGVIALFAAIPAAADRARLLREFVATRPDLFGTRGADNDCFFLPDSNQSADVTICADWISRWGQPEVLIPALAAAIAAFRPDGGLGDLEVSGSGLGSGAVATVIDTGLVAYPLPFTHKFEPGTYTVMVTMPDGRGAQKTATVNAGRRTGVVFTANDLPTPQVLVYEPPTTPPPSSPSTTGGIRVTGMSPVAPYDISAYLSGADGTTSLFVNGEKQGLQPGTWTVSALYNGDPAQAPADPLFHSPPVVVLPGQVVEVAFSSFTPAGGTAVVVASSDTGLSTTAKAGIALGGAAALGLGAWAVFGRKPAAPVKKSRKNPGRRGR